MKKDGHPRNPETDSPADRIIGRIKRRRIVAIAIVVGTITIAIGSFLGAVSKIGEFLARLGDPRPTTVADLQNAVRATALELKQSFETAVARKVPPIPESDFAPVNRLIGRIERLDPGNGHTIYYRGIEERWRGERLASHQMLFWYLERAKDPALGMPGDDGATRYCFENPHGYCRERQAYIHHVLALDFERAANEERDPAIALRRLEAALDHARQAIDLYGEFNAPDQGTPTRTLADTLTKRIAETKQRLSALTPAGKTR